VRSLLIAKQTILNQISTIRANMEDDLTIAKEEISQKIGPIINKDSMDHQDHPDVSEDSSEQTHTIPETTLSPKIADEVSNSMNYFVGRRHWGINLEFD
jgi:hypothetical protein